MHDFDYDVMQKKRITRAAWGACSSVVIRTSTTTPTTVAAGLLRLVLSRVSNNQAP